MLAVDQDGIVASPVSHRKGGQILAKTVKAGDVVVGLFNTGDAARSLATNTSALGLTRCKAGYGVENLWTGGQSTDSTGAIAERVPADGVALLDVSSLCAG